MIAVASPVIDAIRRHAEQAYPHECCGALIAAGGVVAESFALENRTASEASRRFLIGPGDYRRAEARADERRAALAGFYHSHPDHPARPSPRDLENAWPNLTYVIVSVIRGRAADLTAWRLTDDRTQFEERALTMPNRVLIPTPLRPYTGQLPAVDTDGRTVGEALGALISRYADLRQHLYTEDGRLRNFVNVYVNDEDIRDLEREATPLKPGDVISIVPSVAGGAPLSVEELPSLTNAEVERYSRHLILPEVGLEGQRRLKAARVLCVGAGGLGSPAALYLAAAGVGTIGIVDFDAVDASNLQRQILHGTPDVGRPKLHSARDRLFALNPGVRVELHDAALTSANALEILDEYDVVLDGADNFPTRYLVNDACVLTGRPNAYGSIFKFEGQASVFAVPGGPCYRCLYPEPPPPGLVPSCAEGGVLGVLPGVIGTIQATETIKLILGAPSTLAGRLLVYDAWTMRFREFKLRRDPQCPVCGDRPTVRELIDYEQFCGVARPGTAAPDQVPEMTVDELNQRLRAGDAPFVLDVREPQEHQICRIPGASLIPLGDLPARVATLLEDARGRDIVVHCKSGARSAKAVRLLHERGVANARNLKGGILAWIDRIDPTLSRY